MAAGKHSSTEITLTIDKSDGGALQDITAYLTKIGDVTVSKGTVTSTPYGVSAAAYLLGVIKDYPAFTLEGFYDDTATDGPDAILNVGRVTHAVTRSFVLTIATGKTLTGEAWITDYKRGTAVGEYTTFSATIQPTGTIAEA
jgi:hypothetical protein